MKIVDRKTFLAMPPNTVFAKFKPDIFEELCIKFESYENDFRYMQINDSIEGNCEALHNSLEDCVKNGTNLPIAFESAFRDGLFDDDQLFAVWDSKDILALVRALNRCVVLNASDGVVVTDNDDAYSDFLALFEPIVTPPGHKSCTRCHEDIGPEPPSEICSRCLDRDEIISDILGGIAEKSGYNVFPARFDGLNNEN